MQVDELYVVLREIYKIRILATNLKQQIETLFPGNTSLSSLQTEISEGLDSIIKDYEKFRF